MAALSVRDPEPDFIPPPPPLPPLPAPASAGAPRRGKGLCAIVRYEYEVCNLVGFSPCWNTDKCLLKATEENEMHLVEEELIEEIEQLDEGWWSGVGSGGAKSGLFPGGFGSDVLGD